MNILKTIGAAVLIAGCCAVIAGCASSNGGNTSGNGGGAANSGPRNDPPPTRTLRDPAWDDYKPKIEKNDVGEVIISLNEVQLSLPKNTAIWGKRAFKVQPNRLKNLTWEQVKDTILYYTWDEGRNWIKLDSPIEHDIRPAGSRYVFPMNVDRDGLIGFYEVCPTLNDTAPTPGTAPREHIYIDTMPPQSRGISVSRTDKGKLKVVWAFDEPLQVRDNKAATVRVNGKDAVTGMPTNGSSELGGENGDVIVEVICKDQAGNVSRPATAQLPPAKLE